MIPYDEGFHKTQTGPLLKADYAEAGRTIGDDDQWVVWPARIERDVCGLGLSYDASLAKHRAEWRAALGLAPPFHPRPTRERVLAIRANFLSMRDSSGLTMLSWFYPSLDPERKADWRACWQAAGLTHVVLCPVMQYPGYLLPWADFRSQPDAYAAANAELLDAGFIPINYMTSGDRGSFSDVARYWPGLLAALQPYAPYIWVVPGFEVVGPGGGWTSAQLSQGLQALHAQLPAAALGVHLQPERATGASHPVESDDPWRGDDEAGFWMRYGGEFADALLYQTPHGRKLLDPNGEGPDVGAWEDRWVEILDRLGVGARGWRKVPCSFFEVSGYDYYHGNATDADVVRLSARAKQLADSRGVTITFGNG